MGRVLSAFDGSGQSVREFCAASGMAERMLRYWLKRREKGAGVIGDSIELTAIKRRKRYQKTG